MDDSKCWCVEWKPKSASVWFPLMDKYFTKGTAQIIMEKYSAKYPNYMFQLTCKGEV